MKKLILFFSISFLISMCLWAQNVPQTIDYQGRLADSDGNYLNGVVTVNFLIYNVETGGTELWNEIQDISTANGIFHVQLGSISAFPVTLFDGADHWLELIVSGETLSPRTVIASVPYSIKAETAYTLQNMGSGSGLDADLLDGQDSSDFADNVHDHSFAEITGQATDPQIPNNITIDYATQAGNSNLLDGLDSSDFITGVNAGTGLNGGGTSGNVSLNVDVPLNITGNVASPNSVIKGVNTGTGYGVYGSRSNFYGYLGSYFHGVFGKNDNNGNYGIIGSSNCGIYGFNSTQYGFGVWGESTGQYGGYFSTNFNSSNTHVVHSEFIGTGYSDPKAVYGKSRPQDYYGYGGYFEGGFYGVYGRIIPTGSSSYQAIRGFVSGGSGANYAFHGYASGSGTNYAGYFQGNVTVTGTFSNPSDERFKENVQPFRNALSKIKLINVHTFNFIQMAEEKKLVLPEGEQIGLIAQELEDILPQLVTHEVHTYDKNEDIEGAEKEMEKIEYKGINYIGLIPVLIEAIKEQQEMIEAQQTQNEKQQRQIDELLGSVGN